MGAGCVCTRCHCRLSVCLPGRHLQASLQPLPRSSAGMQHLLHDLQMQPGPCQPPAACTHHRNSRIPIVKPESISSAALRTEVQRALPTVSQAVLSKAHAHDLKPCLQPH